MFCYPYPKGANTKTGKITKLLKTGNKSNIDVTDVTMTPNEFKNGTITIAGVGYEVKQNTKTKVFTKDGDVVKIAFELVDDDVDSRLPYTLPTTLMIDAFKEAFCLSKIDGGNDLANNQVGANASVPFKHNRTGSQLDAIATRGSAASEKDRFWVVYIGSAWQYSANSDDDPNWTDADGDGMLDPGEGEGGTGGVCFSTVSNTVVAKGGHCSWVFVETCLDRENNDSPKADPDLIKRDVAHEVGHQCGLGHLSDTIMNASQQKKPAKLGFGAQHLHLLRSRVKSPGQ